VEIYKQCPKCGHTRAIRHYERDGFGQESLKVTCLGCRYVSYEPCKDAKMDKGGE